MEYAVGAALAVAVGLFATLSGFDRDRAFYPAVLVVVASYYDLFGIIGGGMDALGVETAAFAVFACLAVIGFRTNLWIVAGALAGHGMFDLVHGRLVANPGVPAWWPMFCLSYDVVAGAYLAWRLAAGRPRAGIRRGMQEDPRPREAPDANIAAGGGAAVPQDLPNAIAVARTTAAAFLAVAMIAGRFLGAGA